MTPTVFRVTSGLASIVGALAATVALAAPVQTYDDNVSSWSVGSGQSNGAFSVARDDAFQGGGLELGLRAQQRRVGPITPTGSPEQNLYLVQTGPDPGTQRAWWNFDFSIGYDGDIESLDFLKLGIFDGISGAAITIVDMIALRPGLQGGPTFDANYADLYQDSTNPVFGWFTPPYDLTSNAGFNYWFVLAAYENGQYMSTRMCVHTGAQCTADPPELPEPGSMALLALGLAGLGAMRRRKAAGSE